MDKLLKINKKVDALDSLKIITQKQALKELEEGKSKLRTKKSKIEKKQMSMADAIKELEEGKASLTPNKVKKVYKVSDKRPKLIREWDTPNIVPNFQAYNMEKYNELKKIISKKKWDDVMIIIQPLLNDLIKVYTIEKIMEGLEFIVEHINDELANDTGKSKNWTSDMAFKTGKDRFGKPLSNEQLKNLRLALYPNEETKEETEQKTKKVLKVSSKPKELENVVVKDLKIPKKRGRPPNPNTIKKVPSGKPRGRPANPNTVKKVPSGKPRGRPPKVGNYDEYDFSLLNMTKEDALSRNERTKTLLGVKDTSRPHAWWKDEKVLKKIIKKELKNIPIRWNNKVEVYNDGWKERLDRGKDVSLLPIINNMSRSIDYNQYKRGNLEYLKKIIIDILKGMVAKPKVAKEPKVAKVAKVAKELKVSKVAKEPVDFGLIEIDEETVLPNGWFNNKKDIFKVLDRFYPKPKPVRFNGVYEVYKHFSEYGGKNKDLPNQWIESKNVVSRIMNDLPKDAGGEYDAFLEKEKNRINMMEVIDEWIKII
jgi:hypothetical protein